MGWGEGHRVVALRKSAVSYAGGRCGRSSCTPSTSMPRSRISSRRLSSMARAMAALRAKNVCALLGFGFGLGFGLGLGQG